MRKENELKLQAQIDEQHERMATLRVEIEELTQQIADAIMDNRSTRSLESQHESKQRELARAEMVVPLLEAKMPVAKLTDEMQVQREFWQSRQALLAKMHENEDARKPLLEQLKPLDKERDELNYRFNAINSNLDHGRIRLRTVYKLSDVEINALHSEDGHGVISERDDDGTE